MVDDQTDEFVSLDRNTTQDPKPTQGQHASFSQEHVGSSAIFTPLTATILRDIAPAAVAKFLRARERYVMEVEARQVDCPSLKAASLLLSVDRTLLKSLFFTDEFEKINKRLTIDTLKETHLEKYLDTLVSAPQGVFDRATINQALQGLRMPMHVMQPEARVQKYFNDFYRRLDEVGCSSFLTENPKKSVKLLLARVEPQVLKTEMRSRVFVRTFSWTKMFALFIQALKVRGSGLQ